MIRLLTIGAHLSIAKGFTHAAKTALAIGGNTFQFFSRNPRGSSVKQPSEKDVEQYRDIIRENSFGPVLAHAPYTMNLAGAKDQVYEFGCTVIREDLARMDAVGIEYFNLHPGSHTGIGVEAGIEKIVAAIRQGINIDGDITVLLETMTGSGSEIGGRFEHLRQILDGVSTPDRMGVCMDTCHVFAAGYDIRDRLDDVLEEFDRIVGLQYLKAIHLNDSMHPLGSGKDRHAEIGKGEIGLDAILRIMTHPELRNLPFYLETPLEEDGHRDEISMIKSIWK